MSHVVKFSEVLASIQASAEQELVLPEGWAQGRAFFGGFSAAIAFQHAKLGVDTEQPVRALTISFVGPLEPGPATLQRTILREGKSVTQVRVDILQQGNVQLSGLFTFGRSRPSQISITDTLPAEVPGRKHGLPFPKTPILPEFAHQFDYSVTVGGLPFSNTQSRKFGGWVRFCTEDAPIDVGLFLGLVDAWPPAVLPMLNQPAPASSLTWTIEFPELLPSNKKASDWWQYVAYIDYAADGYGHTHSHIWDDEGKLVAISRQTITVFV